MTTSESVYEVGERLYNDVRVEETNPAEIITGILMKNGFVILPYVDEGFADRTIIVNYGETAMRSNPFFDTREITVQILSADTLDVLCTATAEGLGGSQADQVRQAIYRAMGEVFQN